MKRVYHRAEVGDKIQNVYHPHTVNEEMLLAIEIIDSDEEHLLSIDTRDSSKGCVALKYSKHRSTGSYDGCNNIGDCKDCLFYENTFRTTDDFVDYLVEHKLITKETLLQLTLGKKLVY